MPYGQFSQTLFGESKYLMDHPPALMCITVTYSGQNEIPNEPATYTHCGRARFPHGQTLMAEQMTSVS